MAFHYGIASGRVFDILSGLPNLLGNGSLCGALVVVVQAFRIGKYFWGIGFAAIAVLFNPAVPIALSHKAFLLLDLACMGAFLVSLAVLQWEPTLSVPSITGRTPGSESL